MEIAFAKTVNLFTGLVIIFQFQMSFMKLKSVYGVCRSDTHQLPFPDGRSYTVSRSSRPRERQWWESTHRSGIPGGSTDNRGHYSDQHQPEETDSDLLTEEGLDNSTQIVNSDHIYYTSKIYGPGDAASKELWVNIEAMDEDNWKVCGFLPNTHRQAQRVNLSFDFPFYGHALKEITVATGGFIYTGDVIHRMLTATQYIAPLMADFDPSLSQNSTVFYFDNGTALVVQWNQIYLQENTSLGPFTFQTILHSDGRIVFIYKEIPININNISDENHPVKVGISDAFGVLHEIEQIPNVRRRTIYEYHKVDLVKTKISNSTAVEILPMPTCLQFSSCGPCVTSQIGFNCSWCSRFQRCSSGFDRYRQDWVDLGCLAERRDPQCLQVTNSTNTTSHHLIHATPPPTLTTSQHRTSSMSSTPVTNTSTITNSSAHSSISRRVKLTPWGPTSQSAEAGGEDMVARSTERLQTGLLMGVVMVMVFMAAFIFMSVYMYNHPTTSISLFFMQQRLTRWPIMKFRRGSHLPSYAQMESPFPDKDDVMAIDPKQSFVMSNRRESEQKEGFIVPDQRECFVVSESS
ncbi:plexin domain-containing protein 2-like isoform X2 [Antennarius striatus]|uniref:plexin domain-containing protein 2-like isoform X2 n=1 Tax=Antennarius striatus TaxID=241820 RepID=UPI0035B16664